MNKYLALTIVVLSTFALTATAAQASTIGEREALGAAQDYLRFEPFSRAGLIHQLESPYGDDYSHADAVWGVDHTHANWYAQAVKAAKGYLKIEHFSRAALIQQLQSPYGDRFTHAQAVYGVNVAYH